MFDGRTKRTKVKAVAWSGKKPVAQTDKRFISWLYLRFIRQTEQRLSTRLVSETGSVTVRQKDVQTDEFSVRQKDVQLDGFTVRQKHVQPDGLLIKQKDVQPDEFTFRQKHVQPDGYTDIRLNCQATIQQNGCVINQLTADTANLIIIITVRCMNKQPLFIAFSTQKGGAGKTTLTVLTASYLHYVKGYNVAVVDCDYPQFSISDMRKRDVEQVMNDHHYKRMAHTMFSQIGKSAYPVVDCSSVDAIGKAEQLQNEEELDFIFFDLPGTLNIAGVIKTLACMDYVFVPISADRVVLESTLQFTTTLHDNLITTGKSNIKGLWMVWNMVDGRERTELYHAYDSAIAELGLQVMKTVIPDSKRFRREMNEGHKAIFRSTLFPIDKTLIKGSNIEELVDEFIETVKQ
jgi:cellulose biosynthesis protein BcsQ